MVTLTTSPLTALTEASFSEVQLPKSDNPLHDYLSSKKDAPPYGDNDKLATLMDKYNRFIASVVQKAYKLRPHEVDEIVGDTFVIIMKRNVQYDPDRSALALLSTITRNAATDYLRRKRTGNVVTQTFTERQEMMGMLDVDQEYALGLATMKGPQTSVQKQLEDAERDERIRAAIDSLPSEQDRFLIRAAFYVGMKYREIAVELGIPEGTVKSKLFSAKRKLELLVRI